MSRLITPEGIHYEGSFEFEESAPPETSLSDFGLSVITRKWRGAAPLLAAFYKKFTLGGNTFNGFYLTTLSDDADPVFPTLTGIYKGFGDGGLGQGGTGSPPATVGTNDLTIQHATATCSSPQKASRDIVYYSPTTTFKYATNVRRTTPKFTGGFASGGLVIISSVIKEEKGKLIYGSAPAGLVTALTLATGWRMTNLSSDPEPNTPFFNNTETWAFQFLEL